MGEVDLVDELCAYADDDSFGRPPFPAIQLVREIQGLRAKIEGVMMGKTEPTSLDVFNHLFTGPNQTVMSNVAGLRAFLMGNGGKIIVRGHIRKVIVEHLGAGAYKVHTEKIPRAALHGEEVEGG